MPRSRLVLDDENHVRLIYDKQSGAAFECFLGRESTVSEAIAYKLQRHTRDKMNYWVKKFLEAGLIEQVGTRQEQRREVPVYRSVADEFVITGQLAYAYATQAEGLLQAEQILMGYLTKTVNMHLERLGADLAVRVYRPSEAYTYTEILTVDELDGGLPSQGFFIQDTPLRVPLPRDKANGFIARLRELDEDIRAAAQETGVPGQTTVFYVGRLSLVEDLD